MQAVEQNWKEKDDFFIENNEHDVYMQVYISVVLDEQVDRKLLKFSDSFHVFECGIVSCSCLNS